MKNLPKKKKVLKCIISLGHRDFHSRISAQGETSTILGGCLKNPRLNPYFVTGFIDAIKEECFFFILFNRSKNSRLGWNIRINFQIKVDIKDRELLCKIQGVHATQQGGVIINNTKSS